MRTIGLDIGTTSICGVLMDVESGAVVVTASRANDTFIAGEHAYERMQSPDRIMEKIFSILEELGKEDVVSIGVTGQMHGIVYTDRDGRAVSPLYTWQDARGQCPCRDGKSYAEVLGSHAGYGNVTNFYNRENGLIPSEAVAFCTIHDYVVMQLTARKTPLVHISDAASFGCFNLATQKYTISDPLIPAMTEQSEVAGKWNGIPVSVAIGDNQASFIGCGCREGDLLVNIGTGSQISLITEKTQAPTGIEVRPLADGKNIFVGCSLCGGRAYAALETFFEAVVEMAGGEKASLYAQMEKAARAKENTDLCFETLFCGTRTEPERRASVTALTTDNFTPGDLTVACLRGIIGELYDLYDSCAVQSRRIVASGNGIRKNQLMKQLIEQMFGMKLVLPSHREEAAYGAALFSLAAAGVHQTIENAQEIVKYDI